MIRVMRRTLRTAPGPLAVRGIVFFAAAAGLWIAAPAAFVSLRLLLPIALAALFAALFPGGRVVGVTMTLIIVSWILSTLAFGEPAGIGRTFMTACALYLTHSAAALAAMLPHDAIVDNQVIIRWAGRSAMVIVASAAVTGIVVLLATRFTPTTSTFAVVGGLGVVAAIVAVLAKAAGLRRR